MTKCECCESLLLFKDCTFKNVSKTFTLKFLISCNGFNVIYIVICLGCLEDYMGKTSVGKTRLRDRVRVYRQHINNQTIKT